MIIVERFDNELPIQHMRNNTYLKFRYCMLFVPYKVLGFMNDDFWKRGKQGSFSGEGYKPFHEDEKRKKSVERMIAERGAAQ